jgi:hypothetical protein
VIPSTEVCVDARLDGLVSNASVLRFCSRCSVSASRPADVSSNVKEAGARALSDRPRGQRRVSE